MSADLLRTAPASGERLASWTGTKTALACRPRPLGAHAETILAEWIGLEPEEIKRRREEGIT